LGHISTFRFRVLESRGLKRPTSFPLYTYRITTAEFAELEEGLCEFLTNRLRCERLGEIARSCTWFPSLFVLYAAEWWRREYDGSGWTWDPIMQRLGAETQSWNPTQRSGCVEQGLEDWTISISQAHGFRFLGSVALQGGLPMKLVAAAQGKLGSLLSRVLRDAAASSADENEIEDWIRHQATSLSETYQRNEIFRLLTDIVLAVLDLKQRTSLSLDQDPIAKLDMTDPSWRDAFPLPVEDSQARQLLDQLVKDAAAVRPHRSKSFATVQRVLESDGESWRLQSTLNIPEYAEGTILRKAFGLSEETVLPRAVAIEVEQGTSAYQMSAARLAGRDLFRILRRPPVSTGEDAAAEHWLTLVLADGTHKRALAHKGEGLSNDLPWLFEEATGTKPVLVRQGSGAVSGSSGLVCIPDSWRAETQIDSEAQPCGSLSGFQRRVFRFTGSVAIIDPAGAVFRCRSNHGQDEKYVGWTGARSTDIQWLSPKEAFRGVPRLCYQSEGVEPSPIPGQVEWRCNGQRVLDLPEAIGPVEGVWVHRGEIEWRSRVVLLGKARNISADPGSTPVSGILHFRDWQLSAAYSETEDVQVHSRVDRNCLSAEVEYTGPGMPPELFELSVFWRGNPQKARMRLPFPSFGAHCFDPHAQRLPDGRILSSDSLFGYRLIAFVKSADSARLRFTLCANGRESDVATIKLTSPEDGTRIEVRLVDHLPRIHRMLANAAEIDAYVRLDLQAGPTRPVSLKIARYSCALGRDQANNLVFVEIGADSLTAECLKSTVVETLRIDDPGEEPHRLEPVESEGLIVGWEFPTTRLEPGPWLIIPERDSAVRFRPLLWTIPDERDGIYSDSELKRALAASDPHERTARLAQIIPHLSAHFDESDWRIVETTAVQLAHLPLCALDLWREFAKSKKGLASIALRSHRFPAGFLERFCSEMPSVWELVPLSIWIEVMSAFELFESRQSLGRATIQSRIEEIGSILPSLRVLLEVAMTIATGKPTKDVEFVLQSRIDLSIQLFLGPESPHQALLRDGAELEWPTDLESLIQFARRGALAKFLRKPEYPFHRDSVVNLPILLGVIAATCTDLGFDFEHRTRAIRQYQDFCPDWFTNAFDLTVARCIAERSIKELEDLRGAEALL
jgi:hypothetical protein